MPARFPLWPITVILDYVLVIQESGSKRRMLSCAAGAPPVTVSGAVPRRGTLWVGGLMR
jgi:hypothetical protein